METRANYALIGLFTLGVVAAAFLFVFWFSGTAKRTEQKSYKVVFSGSVSGLTRGGAVLFNGLKVGEVTDLGLMPEDPSRVAANITVDALTPVKIDTKAQLELGTLTGVAAVALKGGSADAKALEPSSVIYGDPSDFQDLVAQARNLAGKADAFLDRANKLVDDNSASLSATMQNVKTFTGALADGSDNLKQALNSLDPAKVRAIVENFQEASGKINTMLGTGVGKYALNDIAEAARSIKKLAENLDSHVLRQYGAFAVDGRKTLDEVNRTLRSFEKNPQQLLFGPKPAIPEYNGGH